MNARVVGAVAAVAVGVAVYAFWPKGPKSPEEEVRAMVAKCVQAAEGHDLAGVSDAIADDFRGPEGTDKQMVKGIIAQQILRNTETVAVFNPALEVSMKGNDLAEVAGKFVFARAKAKSVTELDPSTVASAYRIEATVERRSDGWQFVRAKYERITWP